ncbi:hypothetical protein EV363DRAFT_1174019 [Boletus edulis]|nr:hypothetical protein EV363DRAFT_1174019 [Boletus edulis]
MSSHFTATPAELSLVNQIFAQADTQKIGILTGDVAVRVFGGAKLHPTVLSEIWGIADEDNNGYLTRKGVAAAVRLMGWAQKGEKVSPALLNKSGPLATIDGVQPPLVPQGTGMSIPKSPPPGLPLLAPQDKAKFARLFQGCGPVNGLLSGDKARNVFVKSKLPVDKLSQIWYLADTQDRGALDLTDFTVAMYLIQATMSSQLSFIPTSLPPGLYEQAGGPAVVAHATGSSAPFGSPATSPLPAIVKQQPVQTNFTGQPPTVTARFQAGPVGQSPAVPPFPGVAPQATALWDVTPVEKANADRVFDTLDSHKRGYIEGDVAVPFLLQSKLPEEVLAQVWDLADINNDGRLTRDGFAVAMYLIQGKLSGKEIPASLPPTLVPPSMRSNGPTSPFATVSPQPAEVRDLLWDDSPPASTVNTQPQHSIFQHHGTGIVPPTISPPPVSRAPQAPQDPFASVPRNCMLSPFHKDLLGDDDESHPPPPLHDQSAEIGNLQNHVNSTNKSLQNAKAERETLEATLANQAAQLSALQTQLASAKASFETETNLLNTLKERHALQNVEIKKVREELIRSESDLSAIRVDKAEIEGSVLRDKEDVRDLNRRMAEVTTQITATKQEVEKVKKDAKQQKGLLAIARKQLATKETEKAKADQELGEAKEDLANTVKEREEAEAEAEKAFVAPQPPSESERGKSPADSLSLAAAHPLPVTPDLTGGILLSPSSGKSNNPFERLAMSSATSTPRSQSPFRSYSTSSVPLPPGLPPPPGLSPPDAVATTLDDPFGISQSFDSGPQLSSEVTPDNDAPDAGVSTPKVKATHGDFGDIVSSPSDEELFSTPPNSTTPSNHGGEATPHFRSLDTAAVHFPALDDIPAGQGDDGKEHETDLSTELQDLDVNETDSDEDSDEEEAHEGTLQDQESRAPEVSPTKNGSTPPPAPVSFDDIFATNGVPAMSASPTSAAAPQTDNVPSTQNGSAAFDAFGMPLTKPAATPEDGQDSGFTIIDAPVNVASKNSSGLSSFEEAFGKSSSTGPAQTVSSFSFESGFEDNFDFAASSGTATEFPSTTLSDAPPVNGGTTTKQTAATANSTQGFFALPVNGSSSVTPKAAPVLAPVPFDDAVSSGPWSVPSSAPQPEKIVANQSGLANISFEEAFGGLDTSQALKLDDSFSPGASNVTNTVPAPQFNTGKPFPVVSPPTSPRGPVAPSSSIRSSSPQLRTTSPPPRVASPKSQRPSTSPSKEVHEKPPPPPRHSKLSIRLPFTKRKKQDTAPPLPTPLSGQHLARVDEPGAVTPAVEDDVVPVKQLTAMGFSRNQAVAALEAHDYDVQRALNSLLGAQ